MIEGLITFLALPSTFVAPIAGWMTWSAYRDGDQRFAIRAGLVFVISGAFLLMGYKVAPSPTNTAGGCYTEWDGRSNPTVCD